MPVSTGYDQLQPKFILGTGQGISAVAEQMVGSDVDRANQLREHLPFFPLAKSKTVVVPRVGTLGTASFVTNQGTPSNDSSTKLIDPAEEVELASLVGTVDLSQYPIDLQSFSISQRELQVEFKIIAIRIAFWQQFFASRQPGGFRGLPDLVAPNQVMDVGDASLTLDMLDELIARVREGDAEMDNKVLVMHTSTFVAFARATRATGGTMTYVMRADRRYAAHNGVPILISDYIPVDILATTVTVSTVWCMTLGFEHKGVFGVVPMGVGDSGLVVERVQGARDTDSTVDRVRWYTAIILGHTRGLACLRRVAVPLHDA